MNTQFLSKSSVESTSFLSELEIHSKQGNAIALTKGDREIVQVIRRYKFFTQRGETVEADGKLHWIYRNDHHKIGKTMWGADFDQNFQTIEAKTKATQEMLSIVQKNKERRAQGLSPLIVDKAFILNKVLTELPKTKEKAVTPTMDALQELGANLTGTAKRRFDSTLSSWQHSLNTSRRITPENIEELRFRTVRNLVTALPKTEPEELPAVIQFLKNSFNHLNPKHKVECIEQLGTKLDLILDRESQKKAADFIKQGLPLLGDEQQMPVLLHLTKILSSIEETQASEVLLLVQARFERLTPEEKANVLQDNLLNETSFPTSPTAQKAILEVVTTQFNSLENEAKSKILLLVAERVTSPISSFQSPSNINDALLFLSGHINDLTPKDMASMFHMLLERGAQVTLAPPESESSEIVVRSTIERGNATSQVKNLTINLLDSFFHLPSQKRAQAFIQLAAESMLFPKSQPIVDSFVLREGFEPLKQEVYAIVQTLPLEEQVALLEMLSRNLNMIDPTINEFTIRLILQNHDKITLSQKYEILKNLAEQLPAIESSKQKEEVLNLLGLSISMLPASEKVEILHRMLSSSSSIHISSALKNKIFETVALYASSLKANSQVEILGECLVHLRKGSPKETELLDLIQQFSPHWTPQQKASLLPFLIQALDRLSKNSLNKFIPLLQSSMNELQTPEDKVSVLQDLIPHLGAVENPAQNQLIDVLLPHAQQLSGEERRTIATLFSKHLGNILDPNTRQRIQSLVREAVGGTQPLSADLAQLKILSLGEDSSEQEQSQAIEMLETSLPNWNSKEQGNVFIELNRASTSPEERERLRPFIQILADSMKSLLPEEQADAARELAESMRDITDDALCAEAYDVWFDLLSHLEPEEKEKLLIQNVCNEDCFPNDDQPEAEKKLVNLMETHFNSFGEKKEDMIIFLTYLLTRDFDPDARTHSIEMIQSALASMSPQGKASIYAIALGHDFERKNSPAIQKTLLESFSRLAPQEKEAICIELASNLEDQPNKGEIVDFIINELGSLSPDVQMRVKTCMKEHIKDVPTNRKEQISAL